MDVRTVTIKQDTAMMKIADLKALKKSQRTAEDDALLSLYTSIAKRGTRVLSLAAAFRQTGLNEFGQPRLAIARGDWPKVVFSTRGDAEHDKSVPGYTYFYRSGKFSEVGKPTERVSTVRLRNDVLPAFKLSKLLSSPVPYVPADIRPKFHLRNYHILFEVEEWTEEMPVDPFLLKHVMGDTYIVIAEWELTELEASLLGSMRSGN
jgi:hypothetical protein